MNFRSFLPVGRTIEWCRACLIDDGPESPSDGKVGPVVWIIYPTLLTLAALPLAVTSYPPLHDYYHWMFQGHIVARLLPWGPEADAVTSAVWRLEWGPTPNLAAPLGIGVLGTWLSPPLATQIFVLLSILMFGLGFAYLARSVHRQATVVEFLGFPCAYGFLIYEGYLSNHFAVGLSFFAIGKLHRSVDRPGRELGWMDCVILAALGAVIYLCHLFGWLTFGIVLCVHVLRLFLRGQGRRGLQLAATLIPAMLMLGGYIASRAGDPDLHFYDALEYKIVALAKPLMLFMRTDPFPPLFSVFWSNVLAVVCIIAVIAVGRPRHEEREARPLQLAAVLLGLIAVMAPVSAVADAYHPDGRLMLSALLLFLAALRCKRLTPSGGLAAAILLSPLLVYHVVEFVRADRLMAEIKATLDRSVPPGVPTLSLTLWGPRDVACEPEDGRSFGTESLTWFDLRRLVELGDVRAELMETSFVKRNTEYGGPIHHVTKSQSLDELQRYPAYRWWVEEFPVLEIMGCPADIRALRRRLGRDYDSVVETEWLIVLRGPPTRAHEHAFSW